MSVIGRGRGSLSIDLLPAGSVLGVDVGCSPKRRSSAVCRMDWSETSLTWIIRRFRATERDREEAICDTIRGRSLEAAAFDGPFRRGLDRIGRYREADQMLTRRIGRMIGKPGQSSSPVGKLLNDHTNLCVMTAIAHGKIRTARHAVAVYNLAVIEHFSLPRCDDR